MESGELVIFVLYMVVSVVLAGLGIPLVMAWVPPNPIYGFRTTRTLQDPNVWYPVNRTTGFWLIVTGMVACGVSIWTFAVSLGLPAAPLVNLAPVVIGVIAMIVHGSVVGRRGMTVRQEQNECDPPIAPREF